MTAELIFNGFTQVPWAKKNMLKEGGRKVRTARDERDREAR